MIARLHAPLPVALYREREAGDGALIFSSWLKSYGKALGLHGEDKKVYFAAQHETVERLLARGRVVVACDPQAPAEVWAWLCFEDKAPGCLVHFVYTKQVYRRFGLASRLVQLAEAMAPGPVSHSHETEAGAVLAAQHPSTYKPEEAQ